jgi:hypothetical protein
MRFGFGRGSKAKEVAADGEVEAEAIREAIKSAAVKQASEKPEQDGRQLGILILPGTRDVMEFWTLYKSIQKSGIPNHVAVFSKADGVWTEEQSPE